MKITEFAKYLQRLEDTPKRLEITDILCDLIKNLTPDEVDKAIYLSLGTLKAPYENPKFNIADKMMIKILTSAYARKDIIQLYDKMGDLGNVALEIAPNIKSKLEIEDVYKHLSELAQAEGTGSQDTKIRLATILMKQLDPLAVKFIVRIILGTTRLGFTELTVIDSLSMLLTNDKSQGEKIEKIYNLHPDMGLIVKKIKEKGMKGIEDIKIETGVPILAQKCQRLADTEEIIEKMGKVWAEYKFDGTRVQAHLDRTKKISKQSLRLRLKGIEQTTIFESSNEDKFLIRTFTRNQEETTHQYPDIAAALNRQVDAQSVILDGEAIGIDKKTGAFLPFQEIMQRKRKYNIAEMTKDIPLKYFVFDILYLNGKDLTEKTLSERRAILKSIVREGDVITVDSHIETDSGDELEEFFEDAKKKHLEGLIVKKPDSVYQAGARSFAWVKLKKADEKLRQLKDTVDVVVLGYYYGRGDRTKFGIGKFLAGIYDKKEDKFKTFTKVGTGLTDEQLREFKVRANKLKTPEKPRNIELNKIYKPDVWVLPKMVVEIGGDEITQSSSHTAEYALRFPRLVKFRDDKKAADCTTLSEIIDLYKTQKRGYY